MFKHSAVIRFIKLFWEGKVLLGVNIDYQNIARTPVIARIAETTIPRAARPS